LIAIAARVLAGAACVLPLALGLLAAGCAAPAGTATAEGHAPAGSKRAGVIALLGESPEFVFRADTPATSVQSVEPAQGWETDFYSETVVSRRMVARGYQPVLPGPGQRAAFKALAGFRAGTPTQPLDLAGARAALEEFVAREKLDLVVIVTPSRLPTQYSGSLDVYGGYGSWSQGKVSGCFASLRVTVAEGRPLRVSRQEIGMRMSRRENPPLVGKRLAELSKANLIEARDCVLDAIDSAHESAMFRMGL